MLCRFLADGNAHAPPAEMTHVVTVTQLAKRITNTATNQLTFLYNRITASEGLFVGTTSSVIAFVNDFNKFFKCPSNNGKASFTVIKVILQHCFLSLNVIVTSKQK